MRFKSIWMHKWTSLFTTNEDYEIFKDEWGRGLAELTGEEIKKGIDHCRNNLEWPPTLMEFKNMCRPIITRAYIEWAKGHPDFDRQNKELSKHGIKDRLT